MGCLQADIRGSGINGMRWYQKTGPGVYGPAGLRTGTLPEIFRGVRGRSGTNRSRAEWLVREVHVRNLRSCRDAHDPILPKYTARPPYSTNNFWPDFCMILNGFTMGNERVVNGRNTWGSEGGSGGVLWIAGRDLEGIIVFARFILRRRLIAFSCLTPVPIPALRCENKDPGLPLQGPGTHG